MDKLLLTGGSGSYGRAFIAEHRDTYDIEFVTNDEYGLWETEKDLGVKGHLCDIRDWWQLRQVFYDMKPDIVIHAAALKHVPFGERFPEEFCRTNIDGTWNVSMWSKYESVKKAIMISTDKAINPSNLYGITKQIAETFFMDDNHSVIRFGNFWGSRGSVIPLWQEQAKTLGYITMTDPKMKRYFITLQRAVNFTVECLDNYKAGSVWTPDMESWTLEELAQEVVPNVPIKIIGNRGNEKMEEEL